MKIAYTSDLHHEFGTQPDIFLNEKVDVLILAGDIDAGKHVVKRALLIANGNADHIVFVTGNHEYYGSRIDKVHTRIEKDIEAYYAHMREEVPLNETFPGVYFLNNSKVNIDGITFAGGTCWTDFNLTGDPFLGKLNAEGAMNDYRRIKINDNGVYRKLRANDVQRMNQMTEFFLFNEIADAREEGRLDKLVFVTHHGPTHMSIDPEFIGSELNPAYANNWGRRIAWDGGPISWHHGHVHTEIEYECGDTTVRCNPWGYPGQRIAPRIKTYEL